jgi:uncharacterized protein YndB with AHSA1/START domain
MPILCVTGTYLEVHRPERLMYTWHWENSDEPQTRVTAEFSDRGSQTEARVSHQGFATEDERENHVVGWTDCIDRLQAMLAGRRG